MQFQPVNNAEYEAEQETRKADLVKKYAPWPESVPYDYEITSAIKGLSKSGKEMITLNVTVFNASGETKIIKDYLGAWNAYKLKRICDANGMTEAYSAGSINDYDLNGKSGKCRLNVRKGEPKNDGTGDVWPDKNEIAEYMKPEPKAKTQRELEDEIGDTIDF